MNNAIDKKFLFLIRGIPGSGRGLIAAKLAENPYRSSDSWPVYSADDFFMHDGVYKFDGAKLAEAHLWCQAQVEEEMKAGIHKIFVSNTFCEGWELTPYYVLAKTYRYMVSSIIVENRHRGTTDKIPEHAAKRMRDRFSVHL